MAKFQLNPGETLIGSGMMSLYLKQGLNEKAVPGQHLYHRPAGVFQNQYDARRVGYGFAAGKHQGLFGERRGDIHPGNNPQPDGRNLFLYGLSGKENCKAGWRSWAFRNYNAGAVK